ncbi:MarR family transcriptional regulator [Streptomyces sp. NPDC048639]|uniref:MarR family transcriptional regulator n=1 Tax=Streptomyces sp. NPDC048639 TaxID=3365581 RepID=UPI003714DCB2
MEGKPRPAATAAEALHRMDQYVALGIVGQHHIAQKLGVSVTDLTCLGFILEAGDQPLTAGDLAERANVTTGAITGVLNRLERAGYARRAPDPSDRRRVRVVADADALAPVITLYQPFYERLDALFADYTPDEIAVLTDWFTRAAGEARAHLAQVRETTAD